MTCANHGIDIPIPCGRWRLCGGCGRRLQWQLIQRFLAGIQQSEEPYVPMFFTLTFALSNAPDEDQAHAAIRSLVSRLRYRDQLGPYGWVLHRQKNGTLHHHGIVHMRYQKDDLKLWRELIKASGFGEQNKLLVAEPKHARYCARYITRSLGMFSPLGRAYSFSQRFPKPDNALQGGPPASRDTVSPEVKDLLRYFRIPVRDDVEHEWEPARGLVR